MVQVRAVAPTRHPQIPIREQPEKQERVKARRRRRTRARERPLKPRRRRRRRRRARAGGGDRQGGGAHRREDPRGPGRQDRRGPVPPRPAWPGPARRPCARHPGIPGCGGTLTSRPRARAAVSRRAAGRRPPAENRARGARPPAAGTPASCSRRRREWRAASLCEGRSVPAAAGRQRRLRLLAWGSGAATGGRGPCA